MFRFESPYFLALLFFIFFFWKRSQAIPISSINFIPSEKRRNNLISLKFIQLLIYLLFVLALSKPQWGNEQKRTSETRRDLVVLVDTSGSMKALDFKIDG